MLGTTKCAVNFRSKPEKADNVIKIIQKDHAVNIVQAKDVPEGWLKIKVGKKPGYVMADFVDITPENKNEEDDPEIKGEIDKDGNYVVDGKIVGKVDGENITITDPEIITETLADKEEGEGDDK